MAEDMIKGWRLNLLARLRRKGTKILPICENPEVIPIAVDLIVEGKLYVCKTEEREKEKTVIIVERDMISV